MSNEKWENAHSVVCPWWLQGLLSNPFRRLFQNPDRILAGFAAPGKTAVDIGCGIGYLTIPLARLLCPEGRVIAVDLQERMLAGARRRAEKAGVSDRIQFHQAAPDGLGISGPADFVLTFWMVHEVPDKERLMKEIRGMLKPDGTWLLAEPPIHVPAASFRKTVALAEGLGFRVLSSPKIRLSRAVLFGLGPR